MDLSTPASANAAPVSPAVSPAEGASPSLEAAYERSISRAQKIQMDSLQRQLKVRTLRCALSKHDNGCAAFPWARFSFVILAPPFTVQCRGMALSVAPSRTLSGITVRDW